MKKHRFKTDLLSVELNPTIRLSLHHSKKKQLQFIHVRSSLSLPTYREAVDTNTERKYFLFFVRQNSLVCLVISRGQADPGIVKKARKANDCVIFNSHTKIDRY